MSAPVYTGFDHLTFTVSNAKQAASYYATRFGFRHVAYRGLETGSRDVVSHVVQQDKVVFVFESPLQPELRKDMTEDISRRGDAVKDVAFAVSDAETIYKKAVTRGAKSIHPPHEERDEHGSVILATVATYGDVQHTFVERRDYTGVFLPGFVDHKTALRWEDPLELLL
ncbi:Glyoxalase/Bleomycin resistance protein/Dihydroxybiphenyl dioxygenase [Jimgerdemannia flammicorona]|uniref:4-hydroxyphenylpyruvate dioxygenase n=2 Tax=Jimgerdemannia flammicorona TaxID=994334 RepID=A0A433QEN3_9FUNG|nr:Glyoxalase/Bleomycin resistance protein/Dihydroxybiphenyl dioxygenase [Jimgerdemannia flammicorona]RUS28242.1 Glyoxalase/Bleomycin resistance protein/Dihydroxybiphenyl dioxygenase [Jimgerdemannia flammicorona]